MLHQWLRGPRQLRLFFLAVMLLLVFTLGLLGWHLMAQEQELAANRLSDQRETAADLSMTALEKHLSSVEQNLSRMLLEGAAAKPAPPAAGAVYVQILPASTRAWPDDGLIYYPELTDAPAAPEPQFDAADKLEFQKKDHLGAARVLRAEAASNDLNVRAAALASLARNYRDAGLFPESLEAYAELTRLGEVPVSGNPSALAGRLGAMLVAEQQKDPAAAASQARELDRELRSGKWHITSATYESLLEVIRRFIPASESEDRSRTALAKGVEDIWERWSRGRASMAAGKESLVTPSGPVLLVWRSTENAITVFAASTAYLESEWLNELKRPMEDRHVRVILTQPDKSSVLGNASAAGGRPATRLSAELPWIIQTFNTGEDAQLGSRRNLLLAGLIVLLVLILTGSWFIGHAVARELAVARLQSDFVSAVSHEFRTPLTTLVQLSELLMRGRVASDEDRQQYYGLLHRESDRLRRMVESLLNFGQLESGTLKFRFEKMDAAALLRQSVAEFAGAREAKGFHFEVETSDSPVVRADPETLRCVFWNLFENAVKYSPDGDTVWVGLAKNNGHVEIAVRDRGVGIPPNEQRRIFERFVRGSAARDRDIRGTGIGLAMARQIVEAHGGEITLESEPGKGSTFRVVLPAV